MSASASKSNQPLTAQHESATPVVSSRFTTAAVEVRDARIASLTELFNRIDVAWENMQRDPELKKRTQSVRFCVNDYERAVIEYSRVVEGFGRTGTFAREKTLRACVDDKTPALSKEEIQAVKKLLFELNRVGNNLNQIVRALHVAVNAGVVETGVASDVLASVQEVGSVLKRTEKRVENIERRGL